MRRLYVVGKHARLLDQLSTCNEEPFKYVLPRLLFVQHNQHIPVVLGTRREGRNLKCENHRNLGLEILKNYIHSSRVQVYRVFE